MLTPGDRIQSFQIWGRIGGGGMSDVWLARHATLSMPVVIKTLRTDVGGSDPTERLERMLTEARLTARIANPHVVRAVDAGMHREVPYLVQEYVDAIDLEELDRRRRRALGVGLPLWFVCDAVAQIAEGLHAAHQTGVLHRDVKPSNLFGSPDVLKLGDFGLAVAKSVGGPGGGSASGTLRFMPPEALRGEPLDRRADVFALGATAFDLRYGRPPYLDPHALVRGEARPAFPPPTGPQGAWFQHVLARMLSPEKNERYHDLTTPRRLLAALARATRRPVGAAHQADGSIQLEGTRIVCEVGDIARAEVDGIVSSANAQLAMRSGVGDSLRAAGGDAIEDEAQKDGQQPLGVCVVTGAGTLRAKNVLHAVSAWEEASCIGRCSQRVLLAAEELGLRTLAIPALGTGAARVAIEAAAAAQVGALLWHVALGGSRLSEVRFVLYDETKLKRFREVLEGVLFAGDDERYADHESTLDGSPIPDEVSGEGPTFYVPPVSR